MKQYIAVLAFTFLCSCKDQTNTTTDSIIASGQMPVIIKDNSGEAHLVYGKGDSIMYASSSDQGKTFSTSTLAATLPGLAASHTRGPQLAATTDELVVTACTNSGNIFSYIMDKAGKWSQAVRVNDMDTVAKENLMALAADGDNAFAVWLDLRDKHNKIVGAKSTDGGKTWSRNMMVYASPDNSVCECCKPSVAIKGSNVYVMFRNWLNGNRDLYLIQSSDSGLSFGQAQKLGNGSWALKGCPMDGGAIVIDKNGNPQTVWNRKGTMYACEPGKAEKELGQGRSCTMETVNGKNVYAWVENGEVVVLKPQGMKKVLGKGQLPVLKAINNEHVLCIWENEKQIHTALLEL
jgi:hypothetical protein